MGRIKLSVVLIIVSVVKCLAMPYDELEDFAEHLKKTSQLSPTLKKGVDPDDYDEDEVVSDHAWEDSGKFEGDLILNERQRRLIVEDVAEGLSRNGIRDGSKRWPNNEVIYYIQKEHFTSDQVQAIESGIEDLARASCVKFRPYRKGDRDAVVIQGSRRGCFSQVGYQGGYQVLNLSGRHPVGRGCFRHGTVVHELLHTLGFYHMQSSPDRDDYVNIIWSNIVQPARHNFRKYNTFSVSDFGVGYDYDSVLHYSRRAFSANGQDTIVPKQSGAQIGQRLGLSDKDTQKLNRMYCDADSDSVQADENTTTKSDSKKKKNKNKPFEGHGIGYHQGKAVAIKLLPAAETYKLPDVPSFHVFDYFSKEPQILSTSEIEGFRIGKEIAYSYNPVDPPTPKEIHTPLHSNADVEKSTDLFNVPLERQSVHNKNDAEAKVAHSIESQLDVSNSTSNHRSVNKSNDSDEQNLDPDLTDAFDRLSKIIKSHVYPSQTPDLSIYKVNDRYVHNYNPSNIKKETNKYSSPLSMKEKQYNEDKMRSAIKFIDTLYDFSSGESMLQGPHNRKNDKKEHEPQKKITYASTEEASGIDNNKKHAVSYKLPLLSKKYNEDKYGSTEFEPLGHYQNKNHYTNIYSPKESQNHKSLSNGDWHNEYLPFDHEYYVNYLKDKLKEPSHDEKANEYDY